MHFDVIEEPDGSRTIRNIGTLSRHLPTAIVRQMGDLHTDSALCQVELDSHAEQSCVSDQCALIIHDLGRPVTVYGYDGGKGRTLQMVDAALGYIDPLTGDRWMLLIHQALLVPGLQHPLLCSNQLRANDIRVNDEPKHMVPNPTEYHNAIAIKTPDSNDKASELIIPLAMSGVFSYFEARKPTLEEWESTHENLCIPLTYDTPEWEPTKLDLAQAENNMVGSDGTFVSDRDAGLWDQERISRVIASLSKDLDPPLANLADALQAHVHVKSKAHRAVKSVKTGTKRWKVGPLALAKRWGIGVGAAQRTVDSTTQDTVKSLANPTLSRRFATHAKLMKCRRLPCKMFTDTMEAKHISWFRKSRYGQVYVTDFGWVGFYPMRQKSDAPDTLVSLANDKGMPTTFVMDNSLEQTKGEFKRIARSYGCRIHQLDTYSPWQNTAEDGIRELKKGSGRTMVSKHVPSVLWDHCYEWEAKILSHTARSHYKLQSQVPEAHLTGQTPDISNLAEFGFYDWVKYYAFADSEQSLGRWLGPADDEIGSAMTFKILQKNCVIYFTATVRPLTEQEWNDPVEIQHRADFDQVVLQRLGQPLVDADIELIDPEAVTKQYEPYADAQGTNEHYPEAEDIHRPFPDTDDDNIVEDEFTPAVNDEYIGATVDVTHRGELRSAKVIERAKDNDGQVTGQANSNPLLDTRKYLVEFPDGDVTEYTANIIAEGMIAQTDEAGYDVKLMEDIIDHKSDGNAVKDADRYFYNRGKQYPKKTTAGWKLCVKWKGGLTSWETLADLKESYPVQIAEYAKAVGINGEPAFAWWTEYVLKKRDRIIAKVTKRYTKITHKFGIEVPTSVEHALRIDTANGNHMWRDAIDKEMENVKVAFKLMGEEDEVPPGYQQMTCHMIFDIKLSEGFRRKARMVAGGHQVDTPAYMTYSSVVSRETVRIVLTLAALNDLEVKAADIQNAFLTAPCAEKIWTILGVEFGPDAGKRAIIVRALYGLAASGKSFGDHLANCLTHMGYRPCHADPDLWMKADTYPDDGTPYYRYILCYVDDVLSCGMAAAGELLKLDHYFKMKPGSLGDPDVYLGNKLKPTVLESGVIAWGLSSSKYVQEAVANVERYLATNALGKGLKKVRSPWPSGYEAELDTSTELNTKDLTFYQHLVGVLHWIVELGRVDVITEVSVLAGYLASPRDGHMDAALHLFSFLKQKHNARLVLDPSYPDIDQSVFLKRDWDGYYGDVKEELPPNMPKPLGKEVDVVMFVDASHANDKVNRRSRTGFFIFVNSALVQWCSKKQPTIETSVFGAEFVAMKNGIETCRGIRYKLRMMGVPISGPTYVYGDNMSVIHNTQKPESTLKKKSNSICYHAIRESVAMEESLTGHIASQENPSDIASKLVPSGQLREHLVSKLLYDIYDQE